LKPYLRDSILLSWVTFSPACVWGTGRAGGANRDRDDSYLAQAANDAWDVEREALAVVVEAPPTTMARVLALLDYQDDLWNAGVDEISGGHLNILCIAVEEALRALHPGA